MTTEPRNKNKKGHLEKAQAELTRRRTAHAYTMASKQNEMRVQQRIDTGGYKAPGSMKG